MQRFEEGVTSLLGDGGEWSDTPHEDTKLTQVQ